MTEHISVMDGCILIIFYTNVHHYETECHAQEPGPLVKGQGHTLRLKVKLKHTLCLEHIFYTHGWISNKPHANVHHCETECRAQEPGPLFKGQGHTLRLKVKLKHTLYLEHISPAWRYFYNIIISHKCSPL